MTDTQELMHRLSTDVEYCSDRLNPKRFMRLRKALMEIEEMYYQDRDADGYLETIE